MDKKKTKARNFMFILYPESMPDNWEECMEKIGVPMAVSPLHDSDVSELQYESMLTEDKKIIDNGGIVYKKPHYHVIYIAKNPVTIESVRNKVKRHLGNSSVSHIEIIDNIESMYKYLTHESKDAIKKKKHKYDSDDIKFINDFDIERYVFLDENEKRSLKNQLLTIVRDEHLVNVIDLLGYLELNGNAHGINNMNDVQDVIGSFPGAFRLWFEGNYQCGYRATYVKKINKDTGEIEVDK
ncbi:MULTISPECIES: replication protein [unclassified Staphylococcus]|uniref:replication protein n=2 Tax=Staphylococcus TaxID=1279 RepID=UPI001950DB08|nr:MULTISPECIES: replication protein [unclassified Staphylococcus]